MLETSTIYYSVFQTFKQVNGIYAIY